MIKFIKDVLQIIVLFLTAAALIFVIVWGLRVESVIDKLNGTPDVPAPVEPVPEPLY